MRIDGLLVNVHGDIRDLLQIDILSLNPLFICIIDPTQIHYLEVVTILGDELEIEYAAIKGYT
jgi:hypothetical protein